MTKTKQELLDNLQDNTSGAILPVHIRDVVDASYNKGKLIYSGIVHLNSIDATEELHWDASTSTIGPTTEIRRSDFDTDKPTNEKWGGNASRFITPSVDIYVDNDYFTQTRDASSTLGAYTDRWVLKNGGVGFSVGDNFRIENGNLTHNTSISSPSIRHNRTKITRQALRDKAVYNPSYQFSEGEAYDNANAQLAWTQSKFDIYANTYPSTSYINLFNDDVSDDVIIDVNVNLVGPSNNVTNLTISEASGEFTTGDCISIHTDATSEPIILEYRGVWNELTGNPLYGSTTGKLKPKDPEFAWVNNKDVTLEVEDYVDVARSFAGMAIDHPKFSEVSLPLFFQPARYSVTQGKNTVTRYQYQARAYPRKTAIYDLKVSDDPYNHRGNTAYEDSPPFWGNHEPYFIYGDPNSNSQALNDYQALILNQSVSAPVLHRTEDMQPGRKIIKIYTTN